MGGKGPSKGLRSTIPYIAGGGGCAVSLCPVPAGCEDPGAVTFWQQLQFPFFWMLNQLWCMARGIAGK